jgi:hypothetical protein
LTLDIFQKTKEVECYESLKINNNDINTKV